MNAPADNEPALLVIGYGNTLRQDDQAGPMVAELIEARALPGVRTLACAQLSPEHAEAVAAARAVVFVDAQQAGPDAAISLRSVRPGESSQVTTHAADPRTLLALAWEVYGRVPPVWLLTVPAERLGFGPEISAATRRGIGMAVEQVVALARKTPVETGAPTSGVFEVRNAEGGAT